MIKIGPLLTSQYKQAVDLLKLQDEIIQTNTEITGFGLLIRSLVFWQHWLPCLMHIAPSTYIAQEDGCLLGIISLHSISKSRGCWQIDKLVVHSQHRGRGIATELLRYVFAQFGSQGVNYFMAEVPALNQVALQLFANCGFCRAARVTYYGVSESVTGALRSGCKEPADSKEQFCLVAKEQQSQLCQLYCDSLPPVLRQALLQAPQDFNVCQQPTFTTVEKSSNKLMRTRIWHWVLKNKERQTLVSAVQVTASPDFGYKLEFTIHPGWRHLTSQLVSYAVTQLIKEAPQAPIWAKTYDFQNEVSESLLNQGFQRSAEAFLLLREHWQKAKQKKQTKKLAVMPQLTNPAVNLPLVVDYHGTKINECK